MLSQWNLEKDVFLESKDMCATVYIYVKYTYTYIRIFFIDDTFSMIAIFGENNWKSK